MKILIFFRLHCFIAFIFISMALLATVPSATDAQPKVVKPKASPPVTVTDSAGNWILDNGIVRATIKKNNGNMSSLIYHGVSIVGRSEFWEQVPSGQVTSVLTIDPAKNGGERGEVAVKGVTGRMD